MLLQYSLHEPRRGREDIKVQIRVICATNRPLDRQIALGRFRQDLYYRINVVNVDLPALRARAEDIPELAAYFLADHCARNNFRPKSMDDDVLPILEGYAWPGNVRELRNTVERMAILTPGDRITAASVPLEIRMPAKTRASSLQETRESAERDRIVQALEQSNWNVSSAARALGIERTHLHKRLKALGLSREVN